MHNLNVAGRGVNMGDGWETARRRGPGNDWVILALGRPCRVEGVEIDTAHFKGNYPDRAALQAALIPAGEGNDLEALTHESEAWPFLLLETKLDMDKEHFFTKELAEVGVVSHLRLSIYPDGGVSRLRIYGRPDGRPEEEK
jgi:allantoicase